MEMVGERRIEAPREKVWDALNDPDALKAAIPGCESVERTGPDSFQAKVAMRIGPMAAKFGGKVTLTDVVAPESYTITGEGNGGAIGFAKGSADVHLTAVGDTATNLRYAVKAQVGGKMAQLGGRLIDSTAKQMADQFFDRFAARLSAPAIAEAAHGAPPTVTDPEAAREVVPVAEAPATEALAAVPSMPAAVLRMVVARLGTEPLGLPLTFWGGSAVMLVILFLMFFTG